jgi:hypothetical protein
VISPVPATISADPHVFLIGRPPMSEYLGFVIAQAVDGQNADKRVLADAWRAANDHVVQLESDEAGAADNVEVEPVPPALEPLRERVLADPVVQRTFSLTPIDVGMVELDRVIVYQKKINLTHAERLRLRVEAAANGEDIFRLCLPFEDRIDPPTAYGPSGPNSWVFKSPSNDFRVLDARVVDASALPPLGVNGVPTYVVAVSVGYGSNYLSALHVDGRLVLNNGSHRAYALRAAGHTHVPCLIQHVSRRDELEVLGGPEHPVTQEPDRYLSSPRPPLLKDYFDEKLCLVADVQRNVRQVQVAISGGAADLPA